ncbi:MAG: hypothetical protein NVS2B7_18750 [Herpetosiphon sp.]
MASEDRQAHYEPAHFDEEVERLRREELPRVREEEIKAAAQRAVARETETEREVVREELNSKVEQAGLETPEQARQDAIRTVPNTLLILGIFLILLLFYIAATRAGGIRGFFQVGTADSGATATSSGRLEPVLGGSQRNGSSRSTATAAATGRGLQGDGNAGGVAGINSVVGPGGAVVAALFWPAYTAYGGVEVCGLPLSELLVVNGREIQWFERCRIEHWPEFAGTPSEFQRGLLGLEYTNGVSFPTQRFFPNRAGLRFFAETSHAVREPFLNYWEKHGGLQAFGFPISEVVQEVLEDGNVHDVQYFERVRMEEHLEHPAQRVMLGLLGRALFLHTPKPTLIPPLAPTPVPLS